LRPEPGIADGTAKLDLLKRGHLLPSSVPTHLAIARKGKNRAMRVSHYTLVGTDGAPLSFARLP
jgi:hypothetical protein